ncbi:MAG: transcriptional repressor LexA [Leptolyngbyaceae bacterium]|nr:transcriptional repressor LexA [Leptolyngbyaceae bacterium]
MLQLTPKQQKLFEWIEGYIAEKHIAPTIREQAAGMGYRSPSPVQSLLNQLKEKGWLTWIPRKSRSIRILKQKGVPIVGAIGASPLLETFTDDNFETIPFELFSLFGKSSREVSRYIAVRVRGDSMIGDAIASGDVVILHPPNGPVKPGTIIAARVGSQMTLKHYHPIDEKKVQLRASNDTYPPIDVEAESLDIQGVYVSLLRGFL